MELTLPTLTHDQIIVLLKEAVAIIEMADFGLAGAYHTYAIPAFEVTLKRLMDDAYAQLMIEHAAEMKKVSEAIQ